jgi:hypothetical protein
MANSSLSVAQLSSLTNAEERALHLLGQGIIPEQAAMASGLSASRISQLLSQESFAARVAELRFESLSKHNDRDAAYDSLEDELLTRMKDCLPLMVRPNEILRAIQTINAAKRRGSSAPSSITEQHTVINLILPTQILTQFALNPQNQVVSIQSESDNNSSNQSLLTIQSGSLLNQIKSKQQEAASNVQLISDAKSIQARGARFQADDF